MDETGCPMVNSHACSNGVHAVAALTAWVTVPTQDSFSSKHCTSSCCHKKGVMKQESMACMQTLITS